MAACALANHNVWAIACVTFIMIAERYSLRPDQRVLTGLLCICAAAYLPSLT
jgi:hypothetical protein